MIVFVSVIIFVLSVLLFVKLCPVANSIVRDTDDVIVTMMLLYAWLIGMMLVTASIAGSIAIIFGIVVTGEVI